MKWFYVINQQRLGPASEEALIALYEEGTLNQDTLVWTQGMPAWQKLNTVLQEETAPEKGLTKPPLASKTPDSPDATSASTEYTFPLIPFDEPASMAQRATALLIDSSLVLLAYLAIEVVRNASKTLETAGELSISTLATHVGILFSIHFVYNVVLLCSEAQATLGMRAMHIHMRTHANERCNYTRILARYFAALASGLFFYGGYLFAFFDSEGKTLHDKLCSTIVMRSI